MSPDEIKTLLDKYFEGESSLEDEARLQDWFREPQADPELQALQPMFRYLKEEKQVTADAGFEARLLDEITKRQGTEGNSRLPQRNTWLSAAATLLILVSACWFYLHPGGNESGRLRMYNRDTFRDPGQAMEAVQKAMLTMSGNLELGNRITMENLDRLHALNKILQ